MGVRVGPRHRRPGRVVQGHATMTPRGPLAGYTRPQRRVIRAIDREADQRHYSGRRGRTLRLAAYETGLAESTLRNLGYGDGSSVNWRQETASSYPNVDRMNLRGSVGRFFDEAEGAYHKGVKPGTLSQSVQRSAYPSRYADQSGQALDILAATRRINWPGGVASRAGGGAGVTPRADRASVGPGGTGVLELIKALDADRPQAPPSVGLESPAFSASAAMPAGYREVQGGGAPAPEETPLADLLALIQPGEGVPRSQITPGQLPGGGGRPGSGGGRIHGLPNYGPSGGRNVQGVVGSPIDRPGVSTHPYVLHAVDLIADILGSPIGVGTGTQHDQMTASGNVSDHWSGGAVDLPATGKRLRAIGRSALIAAGMSTRQARHATGGLYNINGWQIIFDTDGPGIGDHTNHVHVKPPAHWRRPRRWRR